MRRVASHRQQVIIRWGLRVVAAGVTLFVVALLPFSLVQSARVENLRIAITAAQKQASTQAERDAATIRAVQAQYEDLFTACQQSPACLAKAPPPSPVVVRGDTGAAGRAGRGIEAVQCTSAGQWLIRYDDGTQETAGGICLGQNGANGGPGTPGQNGADSTVPGPPGPASTVPGPPGANGQDGRGIQSATCDDNGRWQITYTTGETQDAGQCRVGLLG